MANRPVYIPTETIPFVTEQLIEFKWHAGFSVSQKQKSIAELHKVAMSIELCKKPLEVSSKSNLPLGVSLSAFNLSISLNSGKKIALENIFQSSKIFLNGGPYKDLLDVSPIEAKRDIRLKESGDLTGFSGRNEIWPIEPKTLYYDWIYMNALHLNPKFVEAVRDYDCFTDIEFNPKKSFNCQARSVALYLGLSSTSNLETALSSPENYKKIVIPKNSSSSYTLPVQHSFI